MSDPVRMNDEQKKAQRSRSVAMGIALAAFVVIVYAVTWYKMGAPLFGRPM